MSRITLPNGITLEGEGPEFQKTLEVLGVNKVDDGVHYTSASKGITPIKEMATPWIKNAICKIYREWAAALSDIEDTKLFLMRLRIGPKTLTIKGLIEELAARK